MQFSQAVGCCYEGLKGGASTALHYTDQAVCFGARSALFVGGRSWTLFTGGVSTAYNLGDQAVRFGGRTTWAVAKNVAALAASLFCATQAFCLANKVLVCSGLVGFGTGVALTLLCLAIFGTQAEPRHT